MSGKKYQCCGLCKNHNQMTPKKSHKCPFKDCDCLLCGLTRRTQCAMKFQQRFWRYQKINHKHSLSDPTSSDQAGNPLPEGKLKTTQMCDKCRNHNKLVAKKNHLCPNLNCSCNFCSITDKRRALMKHQQRIRRSRVLAPSQKGGDPDDPATADGAMSGDEDPSGGAGDARGELEDQTLSVQELKTFYDSNLLKESEAIEDTDDFLQKILTLHSEYKPPPTSEQASTYSPTSPTASSSSLHATGGSHEAAFSYTSQSPLSSSSDSPPQMTSLEPLESGSPPPLESSSHSPFMGSYPPLLTESSSSSALGTISQSLLGRSCLSPFKGSSDSAIQRTSSPFTSSSRRPFESSSPPPLESRFYPQFESSSPPPLESTLHTSLRSSSPPPLESSLHSPLESSSPPPLENTLHPRFGSSFYSSFRTIPPQPLESGSQPSFMTSSAPPFETSVHPEFRLGLPAPFPLAASFATLNHSGRLPPLSESRGPFPTLTHTPHLCPRYGSPPPLIPLDEFNSSSNDLLTGHFPYRRHKQAPQQSPELPDFTAVAASIIQKQLDEQQMEYKS